ncbi:MAG: hypothetical protein HZB23_15725 [Deltaproteobacteria bacterium]|nr:hypothetical protein [Deltaproteobacteria bacterium]
MFLAYKHNAILAVLLLAIGVQTIEAKENVSILHIVSKESISGLCSWALDNEELIAVMRKEHNTGKAILEVYRSASNSDKAIGRFILGSFPYSLTQFTDKLIAVCQTATGYLVYVFEYRNGEVIKIVDDGSNLQPELIYFGPSVHPAIAVPVLDWVDGSHVPVFAKVYLLEGKNLRKALKLPWKGRFGLAK